MPGSSGSMDICRTTSRAAALASGSASSSAVCRQRAHSDAAGSRPPAPWSTVAWCWLRRVIGRSSPGHYGCRTALRCICWVATPVIPPLPHWPIPTVRSGRRAGAARCPAGLRMVTAGSPTCESGPEPQDLRSPQPLLPREAGGPWLWILNVSVRTMILECWHRSPTGKPV